MCGWPGAATLAPMSELADLGKETYVSLTTFRKDGTPVSTPVWVVGDEGRLLVWSAASTWKVRRIRRDPHVRVAPCGGTGKLRGPALEGRARIVSDVSLVARLLARKYRVGYPLLHGFNALVRWVRRKPPAVSVTIEIVSPSA